MQYTMSEIQAYLNQMYARPTPQGMAVPRMTLVPYGYTLTYLALAAAGTSSQQLNIAANGDFLITSVRYHAAIGGAAQNVGNKTVAICRMLITDSGSNEQFTSQAVDLENFARNDAKLQDMPWPRLVQGKSSLSVALTNYSNGDTYSTIDVFFSGILVRVLD